MAEPRASRDSGVKDLEELLRKGKSARSTFEPDWFLNMAYYAGDQWLYWAGGKLNRPALRKGRVTLVDNRIQPAIRTEVAKMTKQKPTWQSTPLSARDEDVDAAQYGETIMEGFWHELHMLRKLRAALYWSRITGAGFWKMYLDSTQGRSTSVLLGPDGKPINDETGRPITADRASGVLDSLPESVRGKVQVKELREGSACVEVRSPFQFVPDPLGEALDSCEWGIEETVQSVDWVQSRFDAGNVKADTTAVAGMVEGRMSSKAYSGRSDYKGVLVKELWARSSSKHAKGRYVVWAGEDILYEGDNPYGTQDRPNSVLPYVMFTGIDVPGRFWPTSTAEQLRGPQTELNKVESQIAENRARVGNASLLLSRQANTKVSGVPGEAIYYDDLVQNAKPDYLRPPELPGYVQAEIERIQQSIMEISGQHEISAGTVPAGVTAASAISLLQEGDDTKLGPASQDMEDALSRAGQMLLEIVAAFYSTSRTMQLAGDDGELDILEFKGAMLRGNTKVRVGMGSMAPQSKAGRQAEMTQILTLLVQNGSTFEPRALRRFAKQYESGALDQLFGDLSRDERSVRRENRKLNEAEKVPVNDFDNHPVHIAGHQDEMKAARWEKLDPAAQEEYRQHVAIHQQAIAPPPPVPAPLNPETGPAMPMMAPPTPEGGPPPEQAPPPDPVQPPTPGA